jgi:hypothetical protein
MLTRRTAQGPSYLFVSAKTATPIPARHAARRDALIEASLDKEVRSISYVASAYVVSERVELDAVVLERADARLLLDVVPARCIRNVAEERLAQIALSELGLKPIVLTAEEIRREPRYANARLGLVVSRHTGVSRIADAHTADAARRRADATRGTAQKHL